MNTNDKPKYRSWAYQGGIRINQDSLRVFAKFNADLKRHFTKEVRLRLHRKG